MTGPVDVERLDADALRALQERRFADQWRYLWDSSPFYRRKLSAAGFSADGSPGLAGIEALPFTWKEEIRESLANHPPLGEHLAAPRSALRQVHTSGGTSGQPSLVGLTRRDAEDWTELLRRGYVAVGHRESDVVLHALSMSQAWVGGLPMVEAVIAVGATVLPIGAEAGTEKLLAMLRLMRPTVVQATPGFLVHLGERAEAAGLPASELGVHHLLCGGEPGGGIPAIRDRISELWGAPVREVMGGTDLACLMWAECEEQDGMHFVGPDVVHFELVDAASGAPVAAEPDAEGELVYTHLRREASPVLRFRHRDLVRVIGTGTCACGRTTPRIRCFGRSDDMLIVKGVNLWPSSIQDALADIGGVGPAFRIVRPRGQYTLPGPVALKVEADPEPPVSPDEVADVLRNRLACRFQVGFVPRGALLERGAHKARFFEEV